MQPNGTTKAPTSQSGTWHGVDLTSFAPTVRSERGHTHSPFYLRIIFRSPDEPTHKTKKKKQQKSCAHVKLYVCAASRANRHTARTDIHYHLPSDTRARTPPCVSTLRRHTARRRQTQYSSHAIGLCVAGAGACGPLCPLGRFAFKCKNNNAATRRRKTSTHTFAHGELIQTGPR